MSGPAGLLQEVMEVLKKASTGMLIDALAISGIKGGIMGVRPARGFEDARVLGPAVTLLYAPVRPDTPKLNTYFVIRNSPPGSVLVIDGKGVDGHFTGDNQGECAKRQGLKGVVVYGGARDIAGYREIGMPLYYTGSATRANPSELQLSAYNVPIVIGGVLVKPGDLIMADEDGVVAVPAESLETVIQNIKVIFEVEERMEQAIQRDAPVEEIMAIISKKKPKV
jgi:4-hydroxy-4-methyl-2-oxoglutarate aldolase